MSIWSGEVKFSEGNMIKKVVDIEDVKIMLSELLEVALEENFTAEDTIEHAMVWLDERFAKSE